MSSFERLGDSAAARKVFACVAEAAQTGVVAIKPVVPLAEVLPTIDLSEVRTRPIDWLWRGYIPLRKVTILDGDPGLGKSTMLLDLACRGSIGGLAPTGEPLGDAFTTIYVTAEDDAEDTIVAVALGDASNDLACPLGAHGDVGRVRNRADASTPQGLRPNRAPTASVSSRAPKGFASGRGAPAGSAPAS
jgi:hypothetical protein